MNQIRNLIVSLATITLAATGCIAGVDDDPVGPVPDPAEPQTSVVDPAELAADVGVEEVDLQVIGDVANSVVHTGRTVRTLSNLFTPALEEGGGGPRARLAASLSDGVIDAGCFSVSWTLNSATVDFDQCQLPETEATLDGSVKLTVRVLQRTMIIDIDDLTVGPGGVTGSMVARLRGPVDALRVEVETNMTVFYGDTALVADGLFIEAKAAGVNVSGSGSVIMGDLDVSAFANTVHWNWGDCLPSSGTLAFDAQDIVGTITFLETTPDDGTINVKLPIIPEFPYELFPPCPWIGQ